LDAGAESSAGLGTRGQGIGAQRTVGQPVGALPEDAYLAASADLGIQPRVDRADHVGAGAENVARAERDDRRINGDRTCRRSVSTRVFLDRTAAID